ncbi:hypothetical protein M422DRAFT_228691 [Sphaerobolus stellatus SS14]|uniref:Kinesin motor domain-containing protein n=1 Tax=Sphaerobolus stellatus (strain SS14) TaxID=990650 RepID=A0A0C9VPK0_SPHS4|nr:hypothetical protein M422DRAFT_228691 [Sphaerobolus stellatus SS14]
MAFRRPATAAGSRKTNAPQVPAANTRRPKSALAKPSSASVDENAPIDTFQPPSPRERSKRPARSNDEGLNIQVVVRCRRRSEREIQEGSSNIVTTNGPRGQDITIETGSATSIFGVMTLAPTRTYPFDNVFGPEADQALIYNDVAAPMLEQVLSGYNCTLFAYGQTGTGKTHTMQGDLTPSPLGGPSSNAGMIPRVLYKMFHYLEENIADYSVKISFVELYNEELRDLLGTEMPTPSGDTQPMSMGTAQGQANGLKIYDDSSKRGVFIQGLEETPVRDASNAIALLTKGSERRQIAATKFNDHSSRSHSVFSITVHIKETSSLGDDMLRVGKLNLVDLAGSENIGRSGAENKRAREAGMINQSLLTLGRVINALVDKSSHVPYRESKLTRLLQDSLGGRTKTCIIATVSPAKSNIEETLSTLEYALRAKSIRNKPEINQRLTKNALLKEYINEIERLKSDLVAAREKSGIWVSQEHWDEMSVKNEERDALILEAKREAIIMESQLRSVREEFELSMVLLQKRDTELAETKETLESTSQTLQLKEEELDVVKSTLQEEMVVRQAHQATEVALDQVATQLKTTLDISMRDIQALFEKIARQASATAATSKSISVDGKTLEGDLLSMQKHLIEYTESQISSHARLQHTTESFQESQIQSLKDHMSVVEGQFKQISEFTELLRAKETSSDNTVQALQQAVVNATKAMKGSFESWCIGLKNDCRLLCGEVQQNGLSNAKAVGEAMTGISNLLQSSLKVAKDHLDQSHAAFNELGSLSNHAARDEIQRLKSQNHMLTQLLHIERVQSDRSKDELIQRISGLLGEYAESRNQRLLEAVSQVQQSISEGETSMDEMLTAQEEKVVVGNKRRIDWETSFGELRTNGNSLLESGNKNLLTVTKSFGEGLTQMQSHMTQAISTHMTEMDTQAGKMDTVCSSAFSELRRIKRARLEATENLHNRHEQGFMLLQNGMTSLSKSVDETITSVFNETSNMTDAIEEYSTNNLDLLSKAQSITRKVVERGTKKAQPTESTPTKRKFNYPKQWTLTKERDEVLQDWRSGISDPPALSPDPTTLQFPTTTDQLPNSGYLSSESEISLEMETEQEGVAIPQGSVATLASSSSSFGRPSQPMIVHHSTGANGFGKVSRIPTGETKPLKDRPTNFVTHRTRRQRTD